MATKGDRPLRVSIFPYIPDLGGDELQGLKKYIATRFEAETGIKVHVSSEPDPYDLKSLESKYLSSNADAYDIMEVDTMLLGELVKSGKVRMLDNVNTGDFFDWCVQSVTVGDGVYGVPTLQCASFLMEVVSDDHSTQSPLLKDWHSFKQLKGTLDNQEDRILLAGDFKGSWTLPMLYLSAYVDEHGKTSVYKGMGSPVEPQLVENLKQFADYGKLKSGNPGTDGTFHKHSELLIDEVVATPHILVYSYSETLGEVLVRAASKKKALQIVSAPLATSNHLITYTDALVVNKCSDPKRKGDIAKFIEFYTSLDFRTTFAFGRDLPPNIDFPRYVLPARKDFFTKTAAAYDKYYQRFYDTLTKHAIPAPNHDIYEKRKDLNKALQTCFE